MGEYAKYKDAEVKIGTCEDMYYLRYKQRHMVEALSGNVDPVRHAAEVRFRFPWPDEDLVKPGEFDPYERAVAIPFIRAPHDLEHYDVQFTARGYNVMLPCPESYAYDLNQKHLEHGYKVHRNGFRGAVLLVQQKYVPGVGLVPILQCGGCGCKWREENEQNIIAAARLLIDDADSHWKQEIGRRMVDGLESEVGKRLVGEMLPA